MTKIYALFALCVAGIATLFAVFKKGESRGAEQVKADLREADAERTSDLQAVEANLAKGNYEVEYKEDGK